MRKFSPRIRSGYPASSTASVKSWLPSGQQLIYENEVLADKPLLYYKLSETSGSQATDSSGFSRNGTYTNSPTLNQSPLITVGASVDFDGTNDFMTYTSNFAITGNFTMECWVRADSFSTYPGLISGWAASTSGNYGSAIVCTTTGVVEIYAANSTFTDWSYTDNTGYQLSTGTTYHLVFVNDDSNNVGYLYVNGALQYTTGAKTTAMGLINIGKNFKIGRGTDAGSDYFNGKVDEVALYATALSSTRISAHYKAGTEGVGA